MVTNGSLCDVIILVLCFLLLADDIVRPNQMPDRGQNDCRGKLFWPFSPVGHVRLVSTNSWVLHGWLRVLVK